MELTTIRFRDLPGVADIEEQIDQYDLGRLMADERADLVRALSRMSIEFFGITQMDTLFDPSFELPAFDAPPSTPRPTEAEVAAVQERWSKHFEWLDEPWTEADDVFWQAIGLDMEDNEGEYLRCLRYFNRQIVCAARGLHPAASFRFRSDMPKTDEQSMAAAEAWGRSLLDD